MTVRRVQAFLTEQYATEVSSKFVGLVNDALTSEAPASLELPYPVVIDNVLHVKFRGDALVRIPIERDQ